MSIDLVSIHMEQHSYLVCCCFFLPFIGILSLPTCVADSGYIVAALIIVFAASAACFCAILLSRCMLYGRKASSNGKGMDNGTDDSFHKMMISYSEIGQFAGGRAGKICAHASVLSMCLGAAILLIILANDMMKNLFGQNFLPNYVLGLINCAILLPFCFLKNYTSVSIIGLIGTISTSLAALMVIALDFVELSDRTIKGPINTTAVTGNIKGTFTCFSTIVFSVGGACVFPVSIQC